MKVELYTALTHVLIFLIDMPIDLTHNAIEIFSFHQTSIETIANCGEI